MTDLIAAQRAYEKSAARTEELRAARDAAVLVALEAKTPHKAIMEATGLSRARVDQIRRGTRR